MAFDNGHTLNVTRRLPPPDAAKKGTPVLDVTLDNNTLSPKTFSLSRPVSSYDEFQYPLGVIDEWVPTLDRIGPKMWRDLATDEKAYFRSGS